MTILSATKSQRLPTTKPETSLLRLTLARTPCWSFGMSTPALLAKPSLTPIQTEWSLLISTTTAPWSLLSAKQLRPPSSGSPYGSGRKNNLALLLPRWMRRWIVSKSSSSSIIIKINLRRLDKQEYYSGCGRAAKEVLNCTRLKFHLRRPSLRRSSSPTHPKLSRERNKVL